MSALHAHALAAQVMADAFAQEAESCGDDRNALLLARISSAYGFAGREMHAIIKREADERAAEPRLELKRP